ncbi:BTB/POZ and MATH domain-containing protein 2-like [Aegilops tauschii subsp. strangulata]|nr:BTB/POZ and MATH domain-containing protein 6-like [Aegilops tauschii subsp. strangulata]
MVSMKLPPPTTRSTITATTSVGTHELKVEGYSETKLLAASEHIESSKFRAAGHDFQICYYPHRHRYQKIDCNANISFFLKMAEAAASNVRVEFRFSLVSRHGGEPARFAGERRVVTFPHEHGGVEYWGLAISKKLEESLEYLGDDSFVLLCEITVVDKPVVKSDDGLAVCRCKDDLSKRRHLRNTADRASWVKDVVVKHFLRCFGI